MLNQAKHYSLAKSGEALFTLSPALGVRGAYNFAVKQLSKDLAKASKTALSKDSAMRLSNKLAKAFNNNKQSKVLKDILKNAKKNETWKSYLGRGATVGKDWIKSAVRGGAENIAIDQSLSLANKVLAGAATTAGSVGAGVAIAKTTN